MPPTLHYFSLAVPLPPSLFWAVNKWIGTRRLSKLLDNKNVDDQRADEHRKRGLTGWWSVYDPEVWTWKRDSLAEEGSILEQPQEVVSITWKWFDSGRRKTQCKRRKGKHVTFPFFREKTIEEKGGIEPTRGVDVLAGELLDPFQESVALVLVVFGVLLEMTEISSHYQFSFFAPSFLGGIWIFQGILYKIWSRRRRAPCSHIQETSRRFSLDFGFINMPRWYSTVFGGFWEPNVRIPVEKSRKIL